MSCRLKRFRDYALHPLQSKMLDRLSFAERKLCEEFIIEHDRLDADAFAFKVNRWYLDQPDKPKHLTDMWALVLQCNTDMAAALPRWERKDRSSVTS